MENQLNFPSNSLYDTSISKEEKGKWKCQQASNVAMIYTYDQTHVPEIVLHVCVVMFMCVFLILMFQRPLKE